jgi:hypothetical protein
MELKGYWATNNHIVGEVVVAEKGDWERKRKKKLLARKGKIGGGWFSANFGLDYLLP